MFTRIVKMEFKESEILTFLANFEIIKKQIRSYPGCLFLELYRDKNQRHVFFTYSKWEKESDLESYRKSELFHKVWSETKAKFSNKAEAWSVDTLYNLS